jgi:hypothetical protein
LVDGATRSWNNQKEIEFLHTRKENMEEIEKSTRGEERAEGDNNNINKKERRDQYGG